MHGCFCWESIGALTHAQAVAALIGLHLVRKAVANCTRPLMRSVLMDHVPKRHRCGVHPHHFCRTFSSVQKLQSILHVVIPHLLLCMTLHAFHACLPGCGVSG
jgi:hypothetical protein